MLNPAAAGVAGAEHWWWWLPGVRFAGVGFGWSDTLGLGSAFPLYISLNFLGYSLLDLTEFDWAAISVD